MKKVMNVPRVNTNDDEMEVVCWYVEEGQYVEIGEDLVSLESAKTTEDIQSEFTGFVRPGCRQGESVAVGGPLASFYDRLEDMQADLETLGTAGTAGEVLAQVGLIVASSDPVAEPVSLLSPAGDSPAASTRVEPVFSTTRFSKAARAWLESHKIDPSRFVNMGLISLKYLQNLDKPELRVAAPEVVVNKAPKEEPAPEGRRSEPVTHVKRREIDYLSAAQNGSLNSSLTIGFQSEPVRRQLLRQDIPQILPLILFELARLLPEYPLFTAYFRDGHIVYHDAVHIGLAMDLGKGLRVPVLKKSDKKSLDEIRAQVNHLTLAYLEDELKVEDLTGSTITVTDLSSQDILHFQPLLNQDQSVILGIGGDSQSPGHPMSLTLVFDHRVLTGRDVGEFLKRLKTRILGSSILQGKRQPKALPGTPASALSRRLLEELRQIGALTLELPLEKLAPHTNLGDVMKGSFEIARLTARLREWFPDLPATFFFEYRTLESAALALTARYSAQLETQFGISARADVEMAIQETVPQSETLPLRLERQEVGLEPVAIVGIAGRYPGALDLESFKSNLENGVSAIRPAPCGRWDGQVDIPIFGGFLDDIDRFDAPFFKISPREAELMDPQQRLFLEVCWQLFENAGYTRENLEHNTGVFVGVIASDYAAMTGQAALGNIRDYRVSDYYHIPNRVSFFFDLNGPSMAVDTACSASGTSIHLACQSLRNGECRQAIAGGVNLFLHPSRFLQYRQMQITSPDGICKPFGAGANGTVYGEGVGALLLKPLSAAERDGDFIYGLIRGHAVNSGGKTNGFTVPNPRAQADMMISALSMARLDSSQIGYIEAHGTGTPLGDPIEFRGLSTAFEEFRDPELDPETGFCGLGSVKANIGHLESGAAIPGIIKILFQMQQQQLYPTLNSAQPNPHLNFDGSAFFLVHEKQPWKRPVRQVRGESRVLPLRAGISSFGAGGSNAHVIVEEYPALPEKPASGEPQVIILSAMDLDRLKVKALQLSRFIQKKTNLEDLAYSLQTGRTPMKYRLALVVTQPEQLAILLESWVAGEPSPQVFSGAVEEQGMSLEPQEADALAAVLCQQGNHLRLARLWVSGANPDWSLLHLADRPRRIPLPSYPFCGPRYWLPESDHSAHPLIDGVRPAQSLGQGLVFFKSVRPELPIVKDHIVMGRPIFPGVGFLEMVRAAFAEAGVPGGFKDLIWAHPAYGEEPQILEIFIKQRDACFSFEIRSQGRELPHVSGSWEPLEAEIQTPSLDVTNLLKDASAILNAAEVYQRFRSMNIHYGPYFQGIQNLRLGSGQALAQLVLPEPWERENSSYILHPSVIDGALQTCLILAVKGAVPDLPFSVASIEIFRSPGTRALAFVQQTGNRCFNIAILDQEGRVCIKIQQLELRQVRDPLSDLYFLPRLVPAGALPDAELPVSQPDQKVWLFLPPRCPGLKKGLTGFFKTSELFECRLGNRTRKGDFHWEVDASQPDSLSKALEGREKPNHILFLAIDIDQARPTSQKSLEQALDRSVFSFFRLLRFLIEKDWCHDLRLTLITNQGHSLDNSDRVNPAAAALLGLARVAATEMPHSLFCSIDIDSHGLDAGMRAEESSLLVNSLLQEPANAGVETIIRQGVRYRQILEPASLPPAEKINVRPGGTYLILGGAGGLGFEFSLDLVKKAKVNLVWLGRSPINQEIEDKMLKIRQSGGQILYCPADACDPKSVEAAIHRARQEFGPIHGAVHSAIVLRDRTLAKMDEQTFRQAFEPKAMGAFSLYRALADEPLDWMLFFSSALSFMASAGQANYVAGCRFKDAFSKDINRAHSWQAQTVNWGYWGSVGIVANQQYRDRILADGQGILETHEGLETLNRLLQLPVPQLLCLRATPQRLAQLGVATDRRTQVGLPPYQKLLPQLTGEVLPPGLDPDFAVRYQTAFDRLEHFGVRLLLRRFNDLGLFSSPGSTLSCQQVYDRIGVVKLYRPLVDAMLNILEKHGVLTRDRQQLTTLAARDFRVEQHQLEIEKSQLEKLPEAAERVGLLWACMQAMPQLLNGSRNHMDVIFPGGSLALVEGIYKGNPVTDYFNNHLAALISQACRQRSAGQGRTLRILEVGAGTGGSSSKVLPALTGLDVVYYYTDISRHFTNHGQQTYGDAHPFARFQTLDLEKEPEDQGLEPASFDIVFGTNVIHAVRDMTATLERLGRLLHPNGLFLANEFTECLDYNTLTFGFTTGWWLFEDAPMRIRDSPLLSLSQWSQLLRANGFTNFSCLGLPAEIEDRTRQFLILAENGPRHSGRIRTAPDANVKAISSNNAAASGLTQPQPVASPKSIQPLTRKSKPIADRVLDYVKAIFGEILKSDPGSIRDNETYENYGVDSLLSMSIARRFEEDLGRLPATLLFEHTTVAELAAYFRKQHQEKLDLIIEQGREEVQLNTAELFQVRAAKENQTPVVPKPEPQTSKGKIEAGTTNIAPADIAVVGVAGRYPQADNLDQFWQNLKYGRNCIREIPKDRWDWRDHYLKGSLNSRSRWGGFINNVDQFDALFFNISPKDAAEMDPQERLFLEITWACLEDAGYTPSRLQQMQNRTDRGIGVFAASMYRQYPLTHSDPTTQALLATSSSWSIANRVSYFLDLNGPSIALDTACAGSLTAIHFACESIRSGESCAAIAGGVNLSLHPAKYADLDRKGMLADHPESRSLGDGNGLIPAEGVGVVLLKPLATALEDGDNIYALIKGSSVNHGGRTSGFTVPNPKAQAQLVSQALERSGIEPETITYVEVAANGSALGDPIEIAGLAKAYGAKTSKRGFCAIGAVKSNIGHPEAASGVAQLTKVLLQMRHGLLVPSLNSQPPNPRLNLEETPFYLQKKLEPWTRTTQEIEGTTSTLPRRAAISSFGAGGANAHLILEEFQVPQQLESDRWPACIITLSARTQTGLRRRASDLLKWLTREEQTGDQDSGLLDLVLARAAEILVLKPSDLDTGTAFEELGLDPVCLGNLILALEQQFCIELEFGQILAAGTLKGVADLLHRLKVRISNPSAPIKPEPLPPLIDLAFTLQTCRVAFPERLAFVVADYQQLRQKLEAFLEGQTHGMARGSARSSETLDDEDEAEFIWNLFQKAKYDKLAALWVKGLDPDWQLYYPEPRPHRLSLPTYPFDHKSYGFPKFHIEPTVNNSGAEVPNLQQIATRPDRKGQELIDPFINWVSQLLQVPPEYIDPQTPLMEYGFDSISLTQLVQRINEAWQLDLSADLFFAYPTLSACVAHLARKWPQKFQEQQPTALHFSAVEPEQPRVTGSDEPIAIIGFDASVPGCSNLDEFWEKLKKGQSMIQEIPLARWDWRKYHGDPTQDGNKTLARWGSFLEGIDLFDPLFFGISPREAQLMDPAQRLFLQTAWRTLEHAGYDPKQFSGSHTGLFVGVSGHDYSSLLKQNEVPLTPYASTGMFCQSILANRVSWYLGLEGPSEIVDTACSSSLVAIHRAVQAIRSGECTTAIAGGVNVLLDPQGFVILDKAGVLSRNGRVSLFHQGSSGYVRGEGVGAVLLKPLATAIADGDYIHGLIKGACVNHDGRSFSLTMPNPQAQARVISRAWQQSGIDPTTVGYIEAQGTGSPMADPVEINALKMAFAELCQLRGLRLPDRPGCGIGYLKPHLGHLEGAYGIIALIKTLHSLNSGIRTGCINVDSQGAKICTDQSPFYVVQQTEAWPDIQGQPRRAGVHAFGFGGVNAHLALEQWRPEKPDSP